MGGRGVGGMGRGALHIDLLTIYFLTGHQESITVTMHSKHSPEHIPARQLAEPSALESEGHG